MVRLQLDSSGIFLAFKTISTTIGCATSLNQEKVVLLLSQRPKREVIP